MNDTSAASPALIDRPMHYLPVGLFGSVMGLTGLSSAWRLAAAHYGVTEVVSELVATLAGMAFVAMAVAYGTKLVFAPDAVRAEFGHPIASNLFGTFVISLLLLPIAIAPVSLTLARAMWLAGTILMVAFAWHMVDRWFNDVQQRHEHVAPAWIVPVVGLLDVPLAVPALQWSGLRPVMVFGLAVGLFFALPLFTLVMARLIFEPPLPPALQPTLLILVAPTAVGVSSYVTVTGRVDLFAECLFLVSLFLLAVLVGRLRYILRACPFRVGWWAVSFPLAACAIAGIRLAAAWRTRWADELALALLAFATLTIAWLLVRTLLGIARGELRQLS